MEPGRYPVMWLGEETDGDGEWSFVGWDEDAA